MTTIAPRRGPDGTFLVGKYLLPAERVIIIQRRHYAAMAIPLAALFGGFVVALFLDIALPTSSAGARDLIWLAWSATCFYLGGSLLSWWFSRFVITNKRLMLVHGIVMRQVDMMPMGKVTDMRYERSVPGRLLGFGAFIMESAGKDQALSRVAYISRPDWLYREICTMLFTPDLVAIAPADDDDGSGSGPGAFRVSWAGFGPDDADPDAPSM
ncbi:PH domain-containing protein [Sporichthya sp.]|uniref:PH domain-containing protein n=1 Tax=Sporichthya sp. TaxID=65475 RepID=UPI00181BF063|nr:PH domain-containing protein [Sporichthya sp.]MBA3742080.1 PH domain-containing protein [Sporichthya sp.]